MLKLRYFIFPLPLLIVCAYQLPPTGGPDDITPPAIIQTHPPYASAKHPVDAPISFVFSEWIDPLLAEQSITIFPPVEDGYKVRVSGKKMSIIPYKSFLDSTTYHIELSNILKDLRGNSIGTPFQLVFSTGTSLDSGSVVGCIVGNSSGNSQPKVALFRHSQEGINDTILLQIPSYLTQTDSSGTFAFDHIRKGTYEVIAFIDQDNNNRLTAGNEAAFSPLDRKLTANYSSEPVVLFPSTSDTVSLVVKSIKTISCKILEGEWLSDVPPEYYPDISRWTVAKMDSTASSPPPVVKEYVPIGKTRRFVLVLENEFSNEAYQLIYPKYRRIVYDTVPQEPLDSVQFNGTTLPDTIAPVLNSAEPKRNAPLSPIITLNWSEPVRITSQEWHISDTVSDTAVITFDSSIYSETTVGTIKGRLRPNRYYKMSIPAEYFEDLSGKHPCDTTDTMTIDVAFETIAEDSLCYLLTGGSECVENDPLGKWMFMPFGTKKPLVCPDSSGRFRFDSIPAAEGTISWFIDKNSDGLASKGSLFPWIPPEPVRAFKDTIEARARWEIEDVYFSVCDPCQKPEKSKEKIPAPKQ